MEVALEAAAVGSLVESCIEAAGRVSGLFLLEESIERKNYYNIFYRYLILSTKYVNSRGLIIIWTRQRQFNCKQNK
jgi:hypothetical protein